MIAKHKKLKIYWLASVCTLALVYIIMELDPRYNPIAMVMLEFSSSQQAFFEIMAEHSYPRAFIEKCLYLDFVFIVSFTSLFCLSLLLLHDYKNTTSKVWQLLLCCIPGILDVIENLLMLKMVREGSIENSAFEFMMVTVYVKWVLVLPLIFLVLIIIFRVAKESSRKVERSVS